MHARVPPTNHKEKEQSPRHFCAEALPEGNPS